MKIGVFDSGLGGLIILKSLVKKLPRYDYVYLGDTKHVPYGNRSQAQIYKFTRQAVDYLFKNNCQLIILACNTASSQALRKIQQQYLPKHYPDRRVLGVIIPAAEQSKGISKIGVLATKATVKSKAFTRELRKVNRKVKVLEQPAPRLVPLIEQGKLEDVDPLLKNYLKKFGEVDAVILGSTHYPIIKSSVRNLLKPSVRIISQTDIIPDKLKNYLKRHPEIENKISKKSQVSLLVTKSTPTFQKLSSKWFGKKIQLRVVKI